MANARGPRGAFWPQDHWGRVTNAAVEAELVEPFARAGADEATDLALHRFGDRLHSVYLAGQAARGRPGGAAFFILLRLGAPFSTPDARANDAWETVAAARLQRLHPALGRVEVSVFGWKDVFTTDGAFSPARFRLAVNSICVAGRNMNRMIAPQRLDAAAMNGDILAFRQRMLNATRRVSLDDGEDNVRSAAIEAGHAVIAAAFALVIEREQVYTEDLDLQRDLFILNYPSRAQDMKDAFRMATRPSTDRLRVLTFIDSASRWMSPLTDAWLNANNPQRRERLKA
ncbi:MAG: hypothetical protein KGS00_07920 [Alphaproteobacteria bacterium]|nr:hypothetical protein [Alphaproteobacteria bacterium]